MGLFKGNVLKEKLEQKEMEVKNLQNENKLMQQVIEDLSHEQAKTDEDMFIRAGSVLKPIRKFKRLIMQEKYYMTKTAALYFLNNIEEKIVEECIKEDQP